MKNDWVIEALCRLARKKPEDLQSHLSLRSIGVSSSFGLSALRSRLESGVGRKLPPIDLNMSVGDLIALVAADGLPAPITTIVARDQASEVPPSQSLPLARVATSIPSALSGMGLGMDLQEINTFPVVRDYRIDPFYAGHFLPSEIATAALRPDPRAHLCGVFCAKEAAKKAHPSLLNLRMDELMVSHDEAGRPSLHLTDVALGSAFTFLISITHTDTMAAATCFVMGSAV